MLYHEVINLQNFNTSILKRNNSLYLYSYNTTYYCLIKLSANTKVKLLNNTSIEIQKNYKIFDRSINMYLKQFYVCDFTKIKFTGKGYKIKKNSKKSIILLFNRAHMTVLWWNNIFIKKLKKYKMYIKYTPSNKKIIQYLLKTRLINIFTKKGLRTSRQVLFKKKGKK
jgi:hypothetical protein